MWGWGRMEKTSRADRLKKKRRRFTKSQGEKEHKIKRRKANWFGHILRRNCLLQHFLEGKMEGDRKMSKKM
jgi:hypothetical protein